MAVMVANQQKTKRRCTDILPLVVFMAALGLLVFVLGYSIRYGNMDKVVYGQDYMSDLCGVDNSVDATGMAEVVDVRIDDTTLVETLWPFNPRLEREAFRLRRGTRDHSGRKLLYFTFPPGFGSGPWPSVALCLDECPAFNESAPAAALDPASWVCTGKWAGGPPAGCDGGRGEGVECEAYRASFFTRVSEEERAACNDPLSDCDVCFPAYGTVQVLNFCMPDPHHALDAVKGVAAAIGELGAVIGGGGGGGGGGGASSAANSTGGGGGDLGGELLDGIKTDGLVVDLERLFEDGAPDATATREFVATLPHLVYEDLVIAAPVIAGCAAAALVFGFAWLLLLRLLAGSMVWISLIAAAGGLGFGCYWLWVTSTRMRDDERYDADSHFTQQADVARVSFFIVCGLAAAYVLALVLLRNKIALAAKVIKVASTAVGALPLMLVLPLLLMACSLAALLFGMVVAMYFVSTGELQLGRVGFGHIALDGWSEGMLLLFCVCTVWLIVFLRHMQYATIGGAVSQWYLHRKEMGTFPVLTALRTVLRYHVGSVALGSALIAALKLVRWLFLFLRRRARACCKCNPAGDPSRKGLSRLCCCCIDCCLRCFEKCLRALCRYAYAQILISGRPFCPSAAEAFRILSCNIAGAATLRLVSAVFLFVGKLFVAVSCASVGAFILLTEPPFTEQLYSVIVPVIAIVLASLLVSLIFFGVYSMATDTIFLCMCLEKDRAKRGLPTVATPLEVKLLEDPADADRYTPVSEPRTTGSTPGSASSATTSTRGGPPATELSGAGNPWGRPKSGKVPEYVGAQQPGGDLYPTSLHL